MPTNEEILAYVESLPAAQRQQAMESGAVAAAIQQGSLAPLQQYAPAPAPEGAPIGPIYDMNNPEGIITARPHGGSYGTYYEGGEAKTEDDAFFRYISAKYRQSFIAPEEGRPVTYSQARSYLANLARPDNPAAMEFSKTRAQELEHATWVSMGRPDIYPDTATSVPQGAYTRSQWEAGTGLSSRAFTPGTEENRALNEGRLKLELSPAFLQRAGIRPENVPERLSMAELSKALARGDSSGVDTGPGIRGETAEEAGARWGRQMGAIGPRGPMGAPSAGPTPAPPPDVILRDLAKPPPSPVGDEYNPEHPSNVFSSYPSGGKITPAMGFTGPDPTLAMFAPPSSRRGMDTLAALGVPLPVMGGGKVSPPPVYMPPPMSRRDVAEALFTPWGQAEILFGGVQKAGQGIRESFGRAGDYYIRQVAGVKPPPRMEVGAPSGDAEKFFAGTSVETRETVVPGFEGGFNPDTGKMEGIPEIRTIQTTERPWVQGEVRMTGRPGQNVKEAILERLTATPGFSPNYEEEMRQAISSRSPAGMLGATGGKLLSFGGFDAMAEAEAKATHEAAKRDARRISIPRTPFFIDVAQPGRVIKEVGSGLSLVPEFIGAAGGGVAKFSGQIVKEPRATVPLLPAAAVAGVVTLGSGLVSIPITIGAKAAADPAAALGFTAGLAAPGMFGGLRRTKTAGAEVRLTGGGPETPIFEMALPRGQSTMGSIYSLPEVVKARVMGRGWDPVLQVWESEKGVLRFPEKSLGALEGTAAAELIPRMKFETLREVTLEKGRTAEMQIPGNIEMRGSMRAWNKGVGGFHNWLNKMGEEALAEWQPRKIKFVQDSPLLTKGELGATIFKKGQSYAEPQTLIVASEQFPSLRGWDARLDNSQFAKAYWETESREMVDTIGHEFRHSIQPFYYNWKPENYAKTRGLLEYDAERFAEQARAAWEAEVGPAVPERVYIHRNLEPEVGAVAKLIETPVVTLPLTKQTFELIQPLSPEGIGVNPLKADFFVPPTKAGAKLVQGAPKGLFKPMYETVKTAEPWMKGTKRLPTYEETVWTDLGEPGFREWKLSPDYPIVRPQNLLEKITRRPAEEIKLVSQKKLLGYEAQTSGALTDFLYGKEAPAGSEIRMRSFELDLPKAMDFGKMGDVTGTEGIKLIGASARATAKAMVEDIRSPVVGAGTLEAIRPAGPTGRLQGLKERVRPPVAVEAEVALGGITSKGGLKYLVTSDFELAAKNIPGATATKDYLAVPFSGKFRVPELRTPLMSEAVNPTVTVRPGFDPIKIARDIMARHVKGEWPTKVPLNINFPGEHIGKRVKIPGPGDIQRPGPGYRVVTPDYVAMDKRVDIIFKRVGKSAPTPGRSKTSRTGGGYSSDAGPRSGAGPGARTAMGIYTGERYGRTKIYEILDVPSEGQGFGFRMEPTVRESLSFRPSAAMLGATGIMAGTKGRFGVSEVSTLSQKEITRIIDKVMVGQAERARPEVVPTFQVPGQKGRQDVVLRVDQLERQGQIPIVGSKEIQKLIDRVVDRTDQGEKVKVGQDVIQKVDIYVPLDTDVPPPDVPPPPQWPPPPVPKVPIIPPWRLPGGGNYGRGGRTRYAPSLKHNPIKSVEEILHGLLPPKPKRGRGLFKGIFLTPPTRRKKKR